MDAMKASSHSVWSRSLRALWLLLAAVLAAASPAAHALRIKEVAAVQGVRSNQLLGYGLVVGLDGTGDQSSQMPYTAQSMSNYLQQLGIVLPPAAMGQLQVGNGSGGRLAPVQRITHTADQQAVLDGGQPLGAFGVTRAHFVFPAIGVGKVTGLVHQCTRKSNFSGNVPPWTLNTNSNPCWTSLTR